MKARTSTRQEAIVASSHYTRERDYWAGKLSGDLVKSSFPYDHDNHDKNDTHDKQDQRQSDKTVVNSSVFDFSTASVSRLLHISNHSNPRLHMILTAALAILLERYSGNTDIIIGTPIYDQGVEGEFVNTVLTLRIALDKRQTCKEFLLSVRQTIIEAIENQNYPISVLPFQANVSFSGSDLPLFDVVILVENLHNKQYISRDTPAIGFIFKRTEDRLQMQLDYNSLLYRDETILRVGKNFLCTLSAVLSNLEVKIGAVDVLSDEEKSMILFEFNTSAADYPKKLTISRLFETQTEMTPDHIAAAGRGQGSVSQSSALDASGVQITYRELDERANRTACFLMEKGFGGGTNPIAAIMMKRSLEMIIGILAILKSGGAYLPIDPDYPHERIDFILNDSAAKVVLTDDLIIKAALHTQKTPLTQVTQPENAVYIIYTSGSTGKPKGVVVEHRNVVRLVKNTNYIAFSEGARLLLTGAVAFDITTFEIWGPLSNGLSLYLAPQEDIVIGERLKDLLVKNRITILHLVPQVFNQLVSAPGGLDIFAGLTYFLVGGDVVNPVYINKLRRKFKGLRILHMYGPTENTTFSTYCVVDRKFDTAVPIGKPIANSCAYVVDRDCKLQPIGVVGELIVGGEGLARGYLNRPELTAEKFVISHLSLVIGNFKRTVIGHLSFVISSSNKRSKATNDRSSKLFTNDQCPMTNDRSFKLYKTGDLCRWLPDGNIEFSGRTDQQVKIRGFRIELGEIENTLRHHEAIEECAIDNRKIDGENRIIAYYKKKNKIELWPSLAEYFIYDDLIYHAMGNDDSRN